MNKKITNNIILILIVAVVAGALIFTITKKSKEPAGALSLYFRPDCPHCQNVEKFISDNGLEKKYEIDMKNIDESGEYANELMTRSQLCSISTESLGVPFLYDSGDCYMGEEEIIDYLRGTI